MKGFLSLPVIRNPNVCFVVPSGPAAVSNTSMVFSEVAAVDAWADSLDRGQLWLLRRRAAENPDGAVNDVLICGTLREAEIDPWRDGSWDTREIPKMQTPARKAVA